MRLAFLFVTMTVLAFQGQGEAHIYDQDHTVAKVMAEETTERPWLGSFPEVGAKHVGETSETDSASHVDDTLGESGPTPSKRVVPGMVIELTHSNGKGCDFTTSKCNLPKPTICRVIDAGGGYVGIIMGKEPYSGDSLTVNPVALA